MPDSFQNSRKNALCAGLLLSGLMLAAVSERASGAPPLKSAHSKPTVQWHHGLKEAHEIALRDNKPILLVFGATWCGPCKKLEKETLAHPELAQYINDNFAAVHLDYDDDIKIAEILEVKSVPAVIVLSPNADLLALRRLRETAAVLRQHFDCIKTALADAAIGPRSVGCSAAATGACRGTGACRIGNTTQGLTVPRAPANAVCTAPDRQFPPMADCSNNAQDRSAAHRLQFAMSTRD